MRRGLVAVFFMLLVAVVTTFKASADEVRWGDYELQPGLVLKRINCNLGFINYTIVNRTSASMDVKLWILVFDRDGDPFPNPNYEGHIHKLPAQNAQQDSHRVGQFCSLIGRLIVHHKIR